jgi:hypothetical protein
MSPLLHFSMSMSPCFHVSISMSLCLQVPMSPCLHVSCLHVSGIPQTENGTKGKRQLPFVILQRENENGKLSFVCCKRKLKFVFLGRQTINGYQGLLFQQTWPVMPFLLGPVCPLRSFTQYLLFNLSVLLSVSFQALLLFQFTPFYDYFR